jgi:DNA-binding NtrC family response regulator
MRKKLSPKARNLLLRHSWPGNVRELDATLRRAFVWSSGVSIDEVDVRDALSPGPRPASEGVLERPLDENFNLPDVLEEVAQHYLRRAMEQASGNKTRAAELVGLASHQTLSNWLSKVQGRVTCRVHIDLMPQLAPGP